MRPLTDEETELVFKKLASYIGDNVRLLIDREDSQYCFRLHKDRVYYCSEALMRKAACIAREQLLSFGTCLGKFTKSKKFHVHITALDYLAPYAKCRVWVKPSAEQQFLYGNNILKSGVGRMSEGCEAYQGVVVYSMSDMPLGFGVTAKVTAFNRMPRGWDLIGGFPCGHGSDPIAAAILVEAGLSLDLLERTSSRYLLRRFIYRVATDRSVAVLESTADCRRAEPTAVVVLHQCDLGEYLRNEAALT